jgi:hypothetical protein
MLIDFGTVGLLDMVAFEKGLPSLVGIENDLLNFRPS